MKRLLTISCIFYLLACGGCENDPEPAVYLYFFQLQTVSENQNVDFFSIRPNYSYKSLTVKSEGGAVWFDSLTNFPGTIDIKPYLRENKLIMPGSTALVNYYIHYGNGDIDTLTQKSFPSAGGGFISQNPDSIYFYLNGKLAIRHNPKQSRLALRNNPAVDNGSSAFDPVIFALVKE